MRPIIPLEEEALAAWMMSGIVLSSPPEFLVCTHPLATRVVMLDFLETYLKGKVLAIVPPYVRMPNYIAEKTLLLQLLERSEGETDPDVLSQELVKGAKRTSYDADTRHLTFILPDQAAASSWHAMSILFAGSAFNFCFPIFEGAKTLLLPRYQQRQQVVTFCTASTVQAILDPNVSCTVTLVSRGCSHGSDAYDSNFCVATFDTVACPEQLKLITHMSTTGMELFLNHYRHFQRVPLIYLSHLADMTRLCSVGGGSATSDLDRWYVSDIHSDWIRDVDFSVPGPAADYNGISVRIRVPRYVVRVHKPRRVYPVPGCAQADAISKIITAMELAQRQVDE
ncbi:hypothetical protein CCR75_004872 [Bremia lactucae]|uniref:Uncharacterized protein n=1 Tax=Bremia lactucae TaxID=4779 RepID=A0A976IHR2_BRELC|nr:hypothetical protein CCR75_004872 [Bremia lactucae]